MKVYYSSVTFKCARSDNYGYPPEIELHTTTEEIRSIYLEHQEMKFGKFQKLENSEQYYTVVLYDGGYYAGWDLRGY